MNSPFIADTVFYIGVNDKELDLFGGQYLVPGGVSCNSYVILDERTAVIHPVNDRVSDQWLARLDQVMDGEPVDYLVISHAEPGYEATIRKFMEKYPDAKLVGNASTFAALGNMFEERCCQVTESSRLELGHHVLQFFLIPSEQCPELMMIYEPMEELLFSADRTGEYGKWARECLERTEDLIIQKTCPMYGPLQDDEEMSGSLAGSREPVGTGKSGFWKMFSGARMF